MLNILIYILLLIIIFIIYNKYYKLDNSEKMTLSEKNNIDAKIRDKILDLYGSGLESIYNLSTLFDYFDYQNMNLFLNKLEFINLLGNLKINGDTTISGTYNLYIQNKLFKQYITDIIHPIGSFYIQYPVANSNNILIALPDTLSPSKLFGGIWEKQWNTESIFFRTEGILSFDARNNGFQDYAIKRLTGKTPYYQPDYNGSRNGLDNFNRPYVNFGEGDQVSSFRGRSYDKIHSDSSYGTDTGVKYIFDNKCCSKVSDKEGRVKNRLFIVWKRTE
jgi:hypothetical protein